MHGWSLATLIVCLLLSFGAFSEASIIIDSGSSISQIRKGTEAVSRRSIVSTSFPTFTTVTVTDSDSSASTTMNWQTSSNETTFSYDFQHVRQGTAKSLSQSIIQLFFTPTRAARFEISGYYNATDMDAIGISRAYEHTLIRHSNGGPILMRSFQNIETSQDQALVIDSLVGKLQANVPYLFFNTSFIGDSLNSDDGASAVGNVTLRLIEIPEPATCTLFLASLSVAFACFRCCKTQRPIHRSNHFGSRILA